MPERVIGRPRRLRKTTAPGSRPATRSASARADSRSSGHRRVFPPLPNKVTREWSALLSANCSPPILSCAASDARAPVWYRNNNKARSRRAVRRMPPYTRRLNATSAVTERSSVSRPAAAGHGPEHRAGPLRGIHLAGHCPAASHRLRAARARGPGLAVIATASPTPTALSALPGTPASVPSMASVRWNATCTGRTRRAGIQPLDYIR